MRKSSHLFWGVIFVIFGILLLLQNLDYLDVGEVIETFWPVILILIGLKMLLKEPERYIFTGKSPGSEASPTSPLSEEAGEVSPSSPAPVTQSIHKLFGEINLNFHDQEISYLNVSNLWVR